jgi:beta-mannanase
MMRGHRWWTFLLIVAVQLLVASVPARAEPGADDSSSVALGIYRPSLPDDLSQLSQYEQDLGRPMPIVAWYAQWGGWKSAFNLADLESVSAHGSMPMITWEPWTGSQAGQPDPSWSLRNGILSGRFDSYIDSWARGMASYGKPVLLRFAHEMHDHPFYPWAVGINGNSAEDYVAAWRYVRAIFARDNATDVEWVWNPHSIAGASVDRYEAVYGSVYPGDDLVDWVGLDVYNTGPDLDWGKPRWESLGEVLSAPYQAATAISTRPVLLPEVGSAESGGSKAQWITNALTTDLSQFPRVRGLVWFDVNKEQAWNLDSSPSALHAWLAAVGQPQFGATALGVMQR